MWVTGLIVLWGVVLVNLLLTFRILRFLRTIQDRQGLEVGAEHDSELPVGEPAPDFRLETVSGEIIASADLVGREVALVFVSPQCGVCRTKLPDLNRLGAAAQARAGVELLLVTDSDPTETHDWIREIREEDGVELGLRILLAPYSTSNFLMRYNPRGLVPYFCYIDGQGVVQARGPLERDEWPRLRRQWEGSAPDGRSSRPSHRYR